MLAPMAMALREQGVPIKIVYLGHRDGTAMMVQKDSDDLRIVRTCAASDRGAEPVFEPVPDHLQGA